MACKEETCESTDNVVNINKLEDAENFENMQVSIQKKKSFMG